MKKFKVHLSIGCYSFIHATHHVQDGRWLRFFDGDDVIAEFNAVSVEKLEEMPEIITDPPAAD